jgi:hypothetical protein
MAYDMVGSIRSGAGVVRAAADASRPTLAVLSDIRTGLPGGSDERDGGDAAVAFLFAAATRPPGAGRAVGAAAATRSSSSAGACRRSASRQWEERFGEHAYVPLGRGRDHGGHQAGGDHRAGRSRT